MGRSGGTGPCRGGCDGVAAVIWCPPRCGSVGRGECREGGRRLGEGRGQHVRNLLAR